MATLNTHWRGFWNYNNGAYSLSAVDSTSLDFGISYGYVNSMTTNDIYITFRDNASVESFLMSLPRPSIPYMIMLLYIANSYIDVNAMTPNHLPTRGRRLFELKNQNPFEFQITPELVEEVKEKGVILTGEHNGGNSSYKMRFNPTYTVLSEYPPATLSNLLQQGDYWERPITVSWLSTNQVKYEAELWQNNNKVGSTLTGTTSKSLVIPANTFSSKENALVKVRVANPQGAWTNWSTLNLSLRDIQATISNLLVSGDLWEAPINLSWQSTDQQQFKIEVLKENVVVRTYTGTTAKHYTIPAEHLSKGEHVFRVWVGYANRFVNNQTRSLTLKDIEATISNLLIEGEHWEKPIKVSWQSTNQQQFKIEVLKSNQVVKTYTGTTSTSYTIVAEQLAEGTYTIKVTVAYANRYVNSSERTVALKNIEAVVNDLSLSGSNIDLELIFSWNSSNQQKYEAEIYKDDVRVKNYSGTTATSIVIPHSSLTTGLHRFRVRVAFKDRWTEWKEITATLTETLPSIGVLEPDGIITERDDPTRVWWTSQNQSKWKLVIDESTTYTGTTEKEKILIAGALQTGKHSMVLTVTYRTSAGVEKHVTKKAEWIVQGRPPTPTITSSSTFVTSRPTIIWDTQDQQGYTLELLKGVEVVYSTEQQNGLIVKHKINTYLENGVYTVRVKVINQYSLESDWGTKQITINAQIDGDIDLDTLLIKEAVRLKWDNPSNKFMKFYILRNDEVIAKTTDTSYVDYTAFGECRYKIRGITVNDVYMDSNICYERCDIRHGIVATIDQLNESIDVGLSRNEFSFNASISLENNTIMLSGRELPVTIFGEHSNNTYSIKFTSKELFKFLEMCKRRQVFLYRDKRQKLYLSITNPSYTIDMLGIEYTVQAIEVDYSEVIDYD